MPTVVFVCIHGIATKRLSTLCSIDSVEGFIKDGDLANRGNIKSYNIGSCCHLMEKNKCTMSYHSPVFPNTTDRQEDIFHQLTHDTEEESPFFSDLGHVFKEKIRKMKESLSSIDSQIFQRIIKRKDNREKSSEFSAILSSVIPPSKAMVHDGVFGLSAALCVPLYVVRRDEHGRRGVPLISSLLKIEIVSSDDTLVSFTTATSFEIKIIYGGVLEWTISRRTIDFIKLHTLLSFRHLQGHLPKLPSFPNQIVYFLDLSRWGWSNSNNQKRELQAQKRRLALEVYLISVVKCLHMDVSTELAEFLEISSFSLLHARRVFLTENSMVKHAVYSSKHFMNEDNSCAKKEDCTDGDEDFPKREDQIDAKGPSLENRVDRTSFLIQKGKEGYLRFQALTYSYDAQQLQRMSLYKRIILWLTKFWKSLKFERKWIYISSSDASIALLDNINSQQPLSVLLCDVNTKISFEDSHILDIPSKIADDPVSMVSIRQSKIDSVIWNFKSTAGASFKCWNVSFQSLYDNNREHFDHQGQYRFNSSNPIRYGQRVKWFVDASSYFDYLVDCIERANVEIYLSGWWISPELYLKRPPFKYPMYRLDRLLTKKAQQGVMIYIIVFKEVPMALPIDSRHTKKTFERCHPNIRTQRHPDHLPGGTLLWAHHEKLVIIDNIWAFLGGIDLCYGRYDDSSHHLTDFFSSHHHQPLIIENSPYWVGQDYYNPRIKDFRSVHDCDSTLIDRTAVPRMPWHDVHMLITGDIVRDLSRSFIAKWNFIKNEKSMHRIEKIPFLMPVQVGERNPAPNAARGDANNTGTSIGACQLLKSCGQWNSGRSVECSIYEAYIDCIRDSKEFIYVENQFFISNSIGIGSDSGHLLNGQIKNKIAAEIVSRVIRAHRNGENFRVVILLPLLPAFESDIYMNQASSLRIILQAQLATFSSMFDQLEKASVFPIENYICIFSLRTCGNINIPRDNFTDTKHIDNGTIGLINTDTVPVTEQIYVHSKVIIIDDRIAIIGSANVNDRSMLGYRDSEVNLILKDDLVNVLEEKEGSVRQLRISLMKEHLGGIDSDYDMLSDDFYHGILLSFARENTLFYRETFYALPDDQVRTWEDYKKFVHLQNESRNEKIVLADRRRGNIVFYPRYFLCNESLEASRFTPEYLLPSQVFY